MKKNVNNVYYLGTIYVKNEEIDYFWSQDARNLSRWTRTIGKPELLERTVAYNQLPSVFQLMFDSSGNIILDEDKIVKKIVLW